MDGVIGDMGAEVARAQRFRTTRWSLVAAAERGSARTALLQLCLHYWYPVYVYARHSGHAPQPAQDLARSFFEQLVGAELSSYVAAPDRPFREFLLAALHRFLLRGGTAQVDAGMFMVAPPISAELMEARHQVDATAAGTPEQAYQRGYALALMSAALNRLRLEARAAGRSELFDALEPFLTLDAAPGQYEEVAARLQLRALAVVVAVKRLKQRFRELVEAELADTVGDAAALDAERDALRRALL